MKAITSGKALITAHRGMGVSDKPRDEYLPGTTFYPENSIAAFKEAIRQNADAIECDIHTTSDGCAMVIHGSKVYPYADYIGERTHLHLSGHEDLQVEKFTQKQLQESFVLKSRWHFFDRCDASTKRSIIADPYQTASIVREKKALLDEDSDWHKIPMLEQLLVLTFEANKSRALERKPLLKLNIELKGKGSAIASLAAIRTFYAANSREEIAQFLPSEQFIFLGRIEVGEVAIMNDLLRGNLSEHKKGHMSLDLADIYAVFRKQYLTTHHHHLEEEFIQSVTIKSNIDAILHWAGVERCPMTNDIIVASYPHDDIQEKLTTPNFVEMLDIATMRGFIANVQDYYRQQECNPKSFKTTIKKVTEGKKELVTTLNKSAHAPEMFKAFYEASARQEWRKEQPALEPQFRQQGWSVTSCHVYVARHLAHAKTNVMLSTGQIFGKNALVDHEDFDLHYAVNEAAIHGLKKIRDVLYAGYNGIDISLFDYTPAIIREIREWNQQQGGNVVTLGATASNWRGSTKENAVIDPLFAVTRAEKIARYCHADLLLKVDEPGLFEEKLMLVRQSNIPKHTGKRVIIDTTTVAFTPVDSPVQEHQRSPHQSNKLSDIVHNKPPRGSYKETVTCDIPLPPPQVTSSYDFGKRVDVSPSPVSKVRNSYDDPPVSRKRLQESGLSLQISVTCK